MNKLLEKIKSKGYWKVAIRPMHYDKNLIKTHEECRLLIENNKVVLRGWDYPHIAKEGIDRISEDSIESSCDWPEGPVYEYWRFYKTGQFVHYFSTREDWRIKEEKIKEFQQEYSTDSTKYLSIISTIYSITEIYKFASTLFEKIDDVKDVKITIELHGAKDRTLMFWDIFMRSLNRAYTCKYAEDIVRSENVFNKNDLALKFDDYALNNSLKLFTDFGWENSSRDIFKEDQRKFLERRI